MKKPGTRVLSIQNPQECRIADPLLNNLLVEAAGIGVKVKAIGLYYDAEDTGVYLYSPDLDIKLNENRGSG